MEQPSPVRRAAFAGRWYPGSADVLREDVDRYLQPPASVPAAIRALVAPHAGIMYSGAVAGRGYAAVRGGDYDVVVLIGPSHYAAFAGVAICARGSFASPLGTVPIDEALADVLVDAGSVVTIDPLVHAREHSLELQLPFLARVLPGVPIVPLLMGSQKRDTVDELVELLAAALAGRRPLLVASSDLSHYRPRPVATALDGVVLDCLARADADGLQAALDRDPHHACGGGPIVTVLRTARGLGATEGRVVHYADSGDVSGDLEQVVGYVSAVVGSPAAPVGSA